MCWWHSYDAPSCLRSKLVPLNAGARSIPTQLILLKGCFKLIPQDAKFLEMFETNISRSRILEAIFLSRARGQYKHN